MGSSETDRGETRVAVLELVVMEGHAEFALVLGAVVVAVADEGYFPLFTREHRVSGAGKCGRLTWSWNLFHEKVS